MAPEIYHVFLSFRGEERKTLAKPLSTALESADFRTFLDESSIATGEIIDSKIPDAIKHSVSAIIFFSTDYATSKWCLDELLLILDRMRSSYFPLIPVYCDGVRSGDVKLQEGSIYLEALEKHKKKHGKEKVKRWMEALREVGRCKGVRVEGRRDDFFKKIVEDVKLKITPIFVKMTPHPLWRLQNVFWEILQDVKEKRRKSTKATNHIEQIGNGVSLYSHPCEPTSIQSKEESISDPSRIVEVGETNHKDGATFVEPVRDEIHQSSTVPGEINEITPNPKWRLQKLFQQILQDVKEKRRKGMKPTNHIEQLGNGVSLHRHQCVPTSIQSKEESIPSRIIEVGKTSHEGGATFVEPAKDEILQISTVPEEINEMTYEHEQFGQLINSTDPCTIPGNNCCACGLGHLCVILLVSHKNFVESLIRKLQGV